MPTVASAQVAVTEIMYDVDGADTGREWIEVENTGSADIPLSAWKLFEGTTNHKIASAKGATALLPGAYAVIADNAAKFLADNPGYSGQLFDSAFSLGNAGETLIIRDAKLRDMASVSYLPSMGAAGDGNSLQRTSGSAAFVPGSPTPGSGEIGIAIVPLPKAVPVAAPKAPKKTALRAATKQPIAVAAAAMSDSAEEPSAQPESEPLAVSGNVAAAAAAPATPLTPWLLGLTAFIALPVAGVVVLRRKKRASWDIVEDTSDTV